MSLVRVPFESLTECLAAADALAGVCDSLRTLAAARLSDEPQLAGELLEVTGQLEHLATRARYRVFTLAGVVPLPPAEEGAP
ncbi:hypothetical protein [Pararhodospirillum photometricum]|uniref:hypothetical protein n=1 Tax=Pararhodospirillum photometricum TaxID=1084 RepID=UPI00030E4FFE|nr:hypothetical protein [Pararhodospirillum photometricum]